MANGEVSLLIWTSATCVSSERRRCRWEKFKIENGLSNYYEKCASRWKKKKNFHRERVSPIEGTSAAASLGHSVYKMFLSLSLPRRASRFSICGAMRRIFYLYIITHIAPSSLSYPPSPPRSPPPPLVLSRPFLLSRTGPSSLSSLLVFPTLLVLSFSRCLPFPPLPSSSSPLSPLSPLLPVTPCIYFILLLNKPLPVILAPTCVFTRTRDPRQTQSPLDARIGLRDRSRHEKYFFSTLPIVLGITLPSRVPSVI